MAAISQRLRELIRLHVTGPAVELAEIEGATVISPDLDFVDAIDLAHAIWQQFRVDIPAPRIPGTTVAELLALIEPPLARRSVT